MKDISNYRKSYEKDALLEKNLTRKPFEFFQKWFQESENENDGEVNAMTISSIGLDGFPKSRVVLLKELTDEGSIFYINYNSEKGKAMEKNPNVCLSFFWQKTERQVIIKGVASKVNTEVSDKYFHSRPHGSQLGAIVSNQSEVIESREILEEKLSKLESEFENKPVNRPENWGGYLVKPVEIEFWQGRKNRLHDRIRYKIQSDFSWKMDRLSP